jgi:glycosyltransferase involved in cell wall biosynthesis
VVHKYPPESLGGTEIHTWSLARAMRARGHAVFVYYPSAGRQAGSQGVSEEEGVQVWRAPLAPRRAAESAPLQFWHTVRDGAIEADFYRFLSAARPELVHFQHVQGVSARLIALARGLPRVLTLHDYWYFCANSQLIRPDRRPCVAPRLGWDCVDCATARADLGWLRLARPLVAVPLYARYRYLRALVGEVDLVTTPSRFLRDQYAQHGFPAERFLVIENGLDPTRFETPTDHPAPRPADGALRLCFLGSLAWQKGLHVLIEAVNGLGEGVTLTVYGSEQTFPDYAAQVRGLARHPGIRFAGALDYRQVGAALRQCDFLVVPSLWYENSPLVIQEAYAAGTPVVASRLGALVEKVVEGSSGRLFSPGDAADLARVLGELRADPAQRAALASQLPPPYTIAEQAAALEGHYARLVAAASRPG